MAKSNMKEIRLVGTELLANNPSKQSYRNLILQLIRHHPTALADVIVTRGYQLDHGHHGKAFAAAYRMKGLHYAIKVLKRRGYKQFFTMSAKERVEWVNQWVKDVQSGAVEDVCDTIPH